MASAVRSQASVARGEMLDPVAVVFPTSACRDVVVLGAGFSRALSEDMPLTDRLGDLIVEELQYEGLIPDELVPQGLPEPSPTWATARFASGQFETWLSRMAEDQPYLRQEENLANRRLFNLCAASLVNIIEEKVAACFKEALSQPWFLPLLGALHARRATVATFNQDTLIERAVEEAGLPDWDKAEWHLARPQPTISWTDVTDGLPPPPALGGWPNDAPKQSFHLYKLHGSTNWFWLPRDPSGSSLVSWWLAGEAQGEASRPNEASARRRFLPGAVPFVVPPTSTKSGFYDNPTVEELWRSARAALAKARRVALVGYSLPATDIVTSNLLRTSLVDQSSGAPIEIVNPRPGPVEAHLLELGVEQGRISTTPTVQAWARQYVLGSAADVVHELRTATMTGLDGNNEPLLLVGTSLGDVLPVEAIRLGPFPGAIELLLEDVPRGQPSTSLHLRPESRPVALRDLCALLTKAPLVDVVLARGPRGCLSPVVATTAYETNMAGDRHLWQVIRTASPVRGLPATVDWLELSAERPASQPYRPSTWDRS